MGLAPRDYLRLATPGQTLSACTRSTALAEAGRQNSENVPPRNDARATEITFHCENTHTRAHTHTHDLKLLWLHGRITKALDGFRLRV